MSKELWYDGSQLDKGNMSLITDAANRGYNVVVVALEMLESLKLSNRIKKAVKVTDFTASDKYKLADIIIIEDIDKVEVVKKLGKEVAYYSRVDDKNGMEHAANVNAGIDYLVIEFKDTTNIPLELILAKQQNKSIKVLKVVTDVTDAIVAMGVMEVGAAGVILKTNLINDISNLKVEIDKKDEKRLKIVECEITDIRHLEIGERACLDTTSVMSENEGMLVGCTSSGGILISSEVHFLPYMNTRPFRVNAGVVSSYVWGPDNMVEYISDLEAGSKLLAVNTEGKARTVNVARVKMERRPLILIVAKHQNVEIKVIMQDDWHMRVFDVKGKAVNITDLKLGDKILGHCSEPGRHVGVKISENITEK